MTRIDTITPFFLLHHHMRVLSYSEMLGKVDKPSQAIYRDTEARPRRAVVMQAKDSKHATRRHKK
jgi:hypothetical protein